MKSRTKLANIIISSFTEDADDWEIAYPENQYGCVVSNRHLEIIIKMPLVSFFEKALVLGLLEELSRLKILDEPIKPSLWGRFKMWRAFLVLQEAKNNNTVQTLANTRFEKTMSDLAFHTAKMKRIMDEHNTNPRKDIEISQERQQAGKSILMQAEDTANSCHLTN